MTRLKKLKWWQLGACLACIIVTWPRIVALGGSEFSGGSVTGFLFRMSHVGSWLFIAALVMAFVLPRIAAIASLAGCVLGAPLHLYFLAPGLFRRVFGGEWKTSFPETYQWDFWAIVGMLTLTAAASICLRSFLVLQDKNRFVREIDSPPGD
jgi:hypothetical protein